MPLEEYAVSLQLLNKLTDISRSAYTKTLVAVLFRKVRVIGWVFIAPAEDHQASFWIHSSLS